MATLTLLAIIGSALCVTLPSADIAAGAKRSPERVGKEGARVSRVRKPRRPKIDGPDVDGEADSEGASEGEDGMSSSDANAACFPGSARVTTSTGQIVALSRLQVGTDVATAAGEVSRVFAFSHRQPAIHHPFVRMVTAVGNLTATEGHFVHTGAGVMRAGSVRKGDCLITASGDAVPVRFVRIVRDVGLFNPHTFSGSIVVDGFRATCFTEAVPIAPAQSLLAPFRWVYAAARSDLLTWFCYSGAPSWATRLF